MHRKHLGRFVRQLRQLDAYHELDKLLRKVCCRPAPPPCPRVRRRCLVSLWLLPVTLHCPPPPLPPVLTGRVSSLTPY